MLRSWGFTATVLRLQGDPGLPFEVSEPCAVASPRPKSVLAALELKTLSLGGRISESDTFALLCTTESDGSSGDNNRRGVVTGVTVTDVFRADYRGVGRFHRDIFDATTQTGRSNYLCKYRGGHSMQ